MTIWKYWYYLEYHEYSMMIQRHIIYLHIIRRKRKLTHHKLTCVGANVQNVARLILDHTAEFPALVIKHVIPNLS